MMGINRLALVLGLMGALGVAAGASLEPAARGEREVESALLAAAQEPAGGKPQEESYQRVYEAFTKLMDNVSNQSLGNVRRLVSRINRLVGGPVKEQPTATAAAAAGPIGQRPIDVDESTEQILLRLDQVTKDTDQHTLSKLNEDVSRLVATMNDAYLRNIRRVIERVNRVVGQPPAGAMHQYQGDRVDDPHQKQPGFPGFDEMIAAMDRMQKSVAQFMRSTTRLLTSG